MCCSSSPMAFPREFSRREILSLNAAEQDAAAHQLGLPHLAAFLASVARLQASEPGGTVRAYLRDLVLTGSFIITSPVTGDDLKSGSSLLLADKAVLFSFPDEPDILLGIGDMSLGYPICTLLILSQALLLPLAASLWGFEERHIPMAADAIRATGWTPSRADSPPTLVIGDTNFAHHSWNQLSALHELLALDLPPDLTVLATQLPLGPLHSILPELPPWPMTTVLDSALQAQNRTGAVFVPTGGRFITADLRGRICRVARERMSARARAIEAALLAASGPILWVSVRTRNRTPLNQHDVLFGLCRCFLSQQAAGTVLIDGFSLADDHVSYPAFQQKQHDAVLEADRQAADALQQALEEHHPGRTQAAIGLTVPDSIALAQHATFYFCHHGTVQHKIGWFTSVPGVVHCNHSLAQAGPGPWVSAQSEVAVTPTYLPPEMIQDAADTPGIYAEFGHLLNQENYTIMNIPAAIATVFDKAADLFKAPSEEQITAIAVPTQLAAVNGNMIAPQTPVSRPPLRHVLAAPDTLVATGMVYTDFFRFIDEHLHPKSYFEIGTHLGSSVKAFTCDAVCVDPQFMLDKDVLSGRGQTHFYQMPSDRYFAENDLHSIFKSGPDICFLDGMHRSEYLLRDFINIERMCHKRSVVFMHDCLPTNTRMTLRTHVPGDPSEGHWQHAWTGDVWKVVPLLHKHRPDLKMVCLDCAPTGLIAIMNLDPASTLLSDRYGQLLEELAALDLETHTLKKLWTTLPVLDTRSLAAHPEDLTLFIDIH